MQGRKNSRGKSHSNHTSKDKKDDDYLFQNYQEQDNDPCEESNLKSFKDINYSGQKQIWLSNISLIKCRSTSPIGISGSNQCLWFSINIKSKLKGNLVSDGCANTSAAAIGSGFVKVSKTEIKFTLVVFDDDISKKSIPIGSSATSIF